MESIKVGFIFSDADDALLKDLKKRAMRMEIDTNKSEIVRGALQALKKTSDSDFKKIITSVPSFKMGAPIKK